MVLPEKAPAITSLHTSAVSLGIHNEDSGRSDDDVIDVRSSTGDVPVVEHGQRFGPLSVECRAEQGLPIGASPPGNCRLGLVGESKDESAKVLMSRTDLLFAPLD